jgi:hypothetical protein
VANFALLREPRRRVIGIVRSLEILQVATDAGCVRNIVIAVDVTLAALNTRVRSRQWKSGLGVIEIRGRPRRRAVANLTRLRNSGSHVIRIRRTLEIFQMA